MKKYYSLRSYARFASRYKWRMLIVAFAFGISDGMIAVLPLFIGKLVGAASAGAAADRIWFYVIVLIGLSMLHDITWRFAEYLYMKWLLPITFQYETGLFYSVIAKPYPYFVGKFTGKIASYVTSLRKEFEDLLDVIFWQYTYLFIGTIAITSILFSVNVYTGLIFIGGMLLMYGSGRFVIKNSLRAEGIYTDASSTKNGKIIDVMGNFVNVKSFGKELSEFKRLRAEQKTVLQKRTRLFWTSMWFWATMSFFVRDLIWPLTIVLNVWLYTQGKIGITELATLLSTLMVFSQQIWEVVWHISQFNFRAARSEEAHRYLFGPHVVSVDEPTEQKSQKIIYKKELRLSNLNFAYPDQPETSVLNAVDLTIKKGEKIGIVGKSGSGKTTLVKLLLGYYELDGSSVLIDDRPVDLNQLRTLISYVPQDATLFNRSIADNIAYAVNGPVSKADIIESSKRALADEFISAIPKKYDAIVGERGVKLSTGQRQRIAIARAMLQDKPLLILDEATSALDSENELLVQKSLENLWEHHTVVSIAHRLSTLRRMDRIVVFDKGRIVEQGTMKELLNKKGAFFELWTHQVDGMIVE